MLSESCYRYEPKQDSENAFIADWLIRLTDIPVLLFQY
jgi:putative transposase